MGGIFGICLIPWLSELFWISIKLWLFWIPWIFRIFLIFWKRKKNNHMGILVMMMPAQRKWMSRTIETKSWNKDKDKHLKKKSKIRKIKNDSQDGASRGEVDEQNYQATSWRAQSCALSTNNPKPPYHMCLTCPYLWCPMDCLALQFFKYCWKQVSMLNFN